jgi:type IV pilus assembly protein PilW
MSAMLEHNSNLLKRARASGVSLIELLVAVTIGGLLIFGATKVYVDSKATYEVNETAARLQETARYALSVIEPDIRMSNYWGLVKGAGIVINQAAQSAASAGAPTSCGNNFAHDLQRNLEANNNGYALGCAAWVHDDRTGTGQVFSSDTLTVRRASVTLATGTTGRLRICSTRIFASLVTDTSACTAAPNGQVNDLVVNTYYVDRDSTQRFGMPALRRHALIAGPAFTEEEIIPGVEDMQVQFGIDPAGTSGSAQRYVNPMAVPIGAQVVSVRIWLLVRAENPEVGFRDNRTYEYADRAVATGTTADLNAANAAGRAYAPADGFRRLLVSRTIQIRNALGT